MAASVFSLILTKLSRPAVSWALSTTMGLVSIAAFGAIPEAQIHRIQKNGKYITQGVFVGGEASRPLSLLDIKVMRSQSGQRERIEFQFANQQGLPLKGPLGFVYVAVEKSPARVVIDLAQVHRTSMDGSTLQKILSASPHVQQAVMTMDPEDRSTNVTLMLEGARRVSVTSKTNEAGHQRLLVDIRSLAGEKE